MKKLFALDKNDKLFEISLLKGIAVIMVIICHIGQGYEDRQFITYAVLTIGQMACQLFFVLSCFSLCLSYEKHQQSYGLFIKRRFIRMAPAYWVTMFVSFLFYLLSLKEVNYQFTPFILNVFLLHGFANYDYNCIVWGGWFVGTIFVFYLLFPLFYKLWSHICKRKCHNILFALILLFYQAIVAIVYYSFYIGCDLISFGYFSYPNQLSSFMMGFVLYDLYKNNRIKTIRYPLLKFIVLLITALIEYYIGTLFKWEFTFNFAPLLFAFSYVYLSSVIIKNKDKKILHSKLSLWVADAGNHSYGIFLSHFFIVYLVVPAFLDFIYDDLGMNVFVGIPIVIIITVYTCVFIGRYYDIVFNKVSDGLSLLGKEKYFKGKTKIV